MCQQGRFRTALSGADGKASLIGIYRYTEAGYAVFSNQRDAHILWF